MILDNEFLTFIKSHPHWPFIKKQLLAQRPVIPVHNPEDDNTEVWKSLSAQQKGFDLCCALFQLDQE